MSHNPDLILSGFKKAGVWPYDARKFQAGVSAESQVAEILSIPTKEKKLEPIKKKYLTTKGKLVTHSTVIEFLKKEKEDKENKEMLRDQKKQEREEKKRKKEEEQQKKKILKEEKKRLKQEEKEEKREEKRAKGKPKKEETKSPVQKKKRKTKA